MRSFAEPRPHSPYASLLELRTAERFVVSSLRLRCLPHARPGQAYPDWRDGFAAVRIDTAGVWGFDALCRILVTTVLQSLDVRALHSDAVGDDEALLLRTLGVLQQGRVVEANAILQYRCPPAAARLALAPAHVFAMSLDARRLRLAPVTPTVQIPPARADAAVADARPRRH
jgi:hypothetical protein